MRTVEIATVLVMILAVACTDNPDDRDEARDLAYRACERFADLPEDESEAEGRERWKDVIALGERAAAKDQAWAVIPYGLRWTLRLADLPDDEARAEADRYPQGEDPFSRAIEACSTVGDEG